MSACAHIKTQPSTPLEFTKTFPTKSDRLGEPPAPPDTAQMLPPARRFLQMKLFKRQSCVAWSKRGPRGWRPPCTPSAPGSVLSFSSCEKEGVGRKLCSIFYSKILTISSLTRFRPCCCLIWVSSHSTLTKE